VGARYSIVLVYHGKKGTILLKGGRHFAHKLLLEMKTPMLIPLDFWERKEF